MSEEYTPQSFRVGPRRVPTVACTECRRPSDPGWRGWRAYLIEDPESDEPPEVAFYCPACSRDLGAA